MTTIAQATATTHVHQVFIKASPEAIWEAITNPEWSQKYGYGGRSVYELHPGGAYTAYASEEMRAYGAPEIVIEGEVLESDPPRRLVLTWHPLFDSATIAEPATRVTYEIEPEEGDITKLTVVHDVEGAPVAGAFVAGEIEGAGGGWSYVLSDIKTLLETGAALTG